MSNSPDKSPAKMEEEEEMNNQLPLKKIPGGYGLPLIGAIKDRYNYFYCQGQDEFFKAKIAQHKSTVFRTNMPPGPFIASDPRVVAVLDAASFPVLLDSSKVEKRNILDGTFMPSVSFTGGHRVCAFLDTAEPQHAKLKSFFSAALSKRKDRFIPLFRAALSHLFDSLEQLLTEDKSPVDFNSLNDRMLFDFLFRLFSDGKEPSEFGIGSGGSALFDKWLFLQLCPLMTLGILPKFLNFVEDILLHVFPLPFFAVKSDYKKLYDAYYSSSTAILDEAVRFGIDRKEACHNLIFLAGFSSYGGFKAWFPTLIKWIAAAGEGLHRRLAEEIRAAVRDHGGVVDFGSLESMPLLKSAVYEAFRIEPPVPFQYGKAREDMVIRSHVARFEVKRGETIFGYQPFATKDPKVFDDAEEFVGDRFVGESGARLLKHVLWSNGRETVDPTADDKQCPGKDLVVLLSRLLVVELFLRYDTFTVESGRLLLGSFVKFKSLTKATT